MRNDIISWLVNCPPSDLNFSLRLKDATSEELYRALGSAKLSKTARSRIESRARALARKNRKEHQ